MSKEFGCGNIFVRQMIFSKKEYQNDGDDNFGVVNGHKHFFDHATFVVRGTVRIDKLDEDNNVIKSITKRAIDGFGWVLIEAGVKHKLTALEPDSIAMCVYSHRNPQGEILEHYDGWDKAYAAYD